MGCSADPKSKTLRNHNAISFRFLAWNCICMKSYFWEYTLKVFMCDCDPRNNIHDNENNDS